MAMNSEFTTLLAQTNESLGTILHIGAGSGDDLKAICDLKPNKVVAVEAAGVLFESLQRKARKFNNVNAIKCWVLPANCNRSTAFLFNNPRYNSLSQPTELTNIYPNITLTSRQDVNGTTLESLISSLQLNTNQLNVLVLSIQGGEVELLQTATYEILKSFTYIFIPAPQKGLYADSWKTANNVDYFDPIISRDADQSIFIYKHNQEAAAVELHLNSLEQSLLKLQQENQEISSQNKKLLERQAEFESEIQVLTEQRQNLQDDNQKAQTNSKEAEEQVGILEDQCKKQKAELEAARKSVSQLNEAVQASERETQILALNNQKLIDENAKLAEELSSELSQAKAHCEKEREHHLKNKEWAEGLADEVKKLRQEKEELVKFKTTNDQLNKKNNELEYRQVKLDEELNKAQVQLNLLTEILFSAGLSND